jgi:hypothetical protein
MRKQRSSFEARIQNYATAAISNEDKTMSNFCAKWTIFCAAGSRNKRREILSALRKDLESNEFFRYEVEHIARDEKVGVGVVAALVSVVSAFLAALSLLSTHTIATPLEWLVFGMIIIIAHSHLYRFSSDIQRGVPIFWSRCIGSSKKWNRKMIRALRRPGQATSGIVEICIW